MADEMNEMLSNINSTEEFMAMYEKMQCSISLDNLLNDPDTELKKFQEWCDFGIAYARKKTQEFESRQGVVAKKLDDVQVISEEISNKQKALSEKQFQLKVEAARKKLYEEIKNELQLDLDYIKGELDEIAEELPRLELEKNDKVQDFRDTYNAHKYASKFYTKYLDLSVEIEEFEGENITCNLYFLSEKGKVKDYYVKLRKSSDQWSLIDSSKHIDKAKFKELQVKLENDNNIQYVTANVRKVFLSIKNKE